MTILNIIIYTSGIFIFSIMTTGILRKYSLRNSILDIPNERSAHSLPMPRGGGLSISLAVLLSAVFLFYLQLLPLNIAIAFSGGGILVTVTGWLDDHMDIPEIWKALSYTIAAIWTVFWLDGLDTLRFGVNVITMHVAGSLFAVLGLAWLINLYNFMDGTDALAAAQAICTGTFSGMLFMFSGRQDLAIMCFVITAASAGFLYWNWPPAKIFMGDAGSCLIGFSFGLLAIVGEKSGALPILVWFILLSIFICDATLTLFMRIINKEKWYTAHRSHAYQRLVQMNVSHTFLAISVLLINVIFIWPLAYIAWRWQSLSVIILAVCILIMFLIWSITQWYFSKSVTGYDR